MTEKEMKHLSREQLLEMLIEQIKLNQEHEEEIALLKSQLDEKVEAVKESGSLAEMLMRLSGVYKATDEAAKNYYDSMVKAAQLQAEEIISEATKKAEIINKENTQ